MRIQGQQKKITFAINSLASASNIVTGATSISVDGLWHHVVGTYDGSSLKVYLDGRLDAEKGYSSSSINNSGQGILIGARQGTGEWWSGPMAEVIWYSSALTYREVGKLFQIGPGGMFQLDRRAYKAPYIGGSDGYFGWQYGGFESQSAAFKAYWARRQSQLIGGGH
jgi:hypothetical protein